MLNRNLGTTVVILALLFLVGVTAAHSAVADGADCETAIAIEVRYHYSGFVSQQAASALDPCRLSLADAIRFQYGYPEYVAPGAVAPSTSDQLAQLAHAIRFQYGYPEYAAPVAGVPPRSDRLMQLANAIRFQYGYPEFAPIATP